MLGDNETNSSMTHQIPWKNYIFAFIITVGIFSTAFYLSNYFGNKKIDQLKSIQDKISIDILSSETQFSLLSELSCTNISDSTYSSELGELGGKLEWSQTNLGNTEEVSYLRKYYSLLQIKDYLLAKKISERCGVKSANILYFYIGAENCSECGKESLVLSSLRDKYPELRVYSFDYTTNLGAVEAMLQIYKIKDTELPALVLDDEVLTGFHSIEDLESRVKDSFKLKETKPESDATSKKSS